MITPFCELSNITYYPPVNEFVSLIREYFNNFLDYLLDTVEHLILFCVLYISLCILLYIFIITWKWLPFDREIRNSKRVLFIIAHPDDECMFFGPTILHYTRKSNCMVYLMCLSTGKFLISIIN